MTPGPPRRRNRPTVFVVVSLVVFVVAAGAAAGIYLATAGSGDDAATSHMGGETAGDPPVQLPPGCELLARQQLQTFVPGKLEPPQETGPEVWDDGIVTVSCTWRNYADDAPYVTLRAEAFASATADLAKENLKTTTARCGDNRPEIQATTVTGADEACLIHTTSKQDTGEFVENADVVARKGTVVVKIYFFHSEARIDDIDSAAATMASATLATVLESQ
jgi:hypothetical protein